MLSSRVLIFSSIDATTNPPHLVFHRLVQPAFFDEVAFVGPHFFPVVARHRFELLDALILELPVCGIQPLGVSINPCGVFPAFLSQEITLREGLFCFVVQTAKAVREVAVFIHSFLRSLPR